MHGTSKLTLYLDFFIDRNVVLVVRLFGYDIYSRRIVKIKGKKTNFVQLLL